MGFPMMDSPKLCLMFSNFWRTGKRASPPGVDALCTSMEPGSLHHELEAKERIRIPRFLSRRLPVENKHKFVFFVEPTIPSTLRSLVVCVESRGTTRVTVQWQRTKRECDWELLSVR